MGPDNFSFADKDYPLFHLRGLRLTVPAKDPLMASALLQTTFSTHVYSEKWDETKHAEERRFEAKGEVRAFCPIRYACSLSLPDLLRHCIGGKAYLGRDSKGNKNHFFYGASDGTPYPIYFRLTKADRIKGVDGVLHIISAYQRPGMKPRSKFEAIKFARLVHRTCPPKS